MGRWSDLATWRGPTVNQGNAMVEHRGVVVHIAEGSFEGTIAWQRNPDANVSSHFVVAKDGRIAQMVDTDVTAWTQRAGNGHWLSIENEGHTPDALTAAQVNANARILAKAHKVYGVPLQIASNPDGRGLGHHSMGGTGCTRWDWGHCDCPGPAIIAQKPAVLTIAKQIINPVEDTVAGYGFQDQDTANNVAYVLLQGIPDPAGSGTRAPLHVAMARLDAEIDAIAAKLGVDLTAVRQKVEQLHNVDEQAVAATILATLTPQAIAAAIPAELAREVADELAGRLAA